MFDESTTSIEKTPCSQPGSKDEFSYIFDDSEFWRQIPAWRDLDSERFGDFNWQQRNAITTITKLEDALKELASPTLVREGRGGVGLSAQPKQTLQWLVEGKPEGRIRGFLGSGGWD